MKENAPRVTLHNNKICQVSERPRTARTGRTFRKFSDRKIQVLFVHLKVSRVSEAHFFLRHRAKSKGISVSVLGPEKGVAIWQRAKKTV